MSLYEQIKGKEIIVKDILMPEYFPAIYIDEYDYVYCYMGVIDKERTLFKSSPYYLKNISPDKAEEYVRGYFRIIDGAIFHEKEFINKKLAYRENAKCKLIDGYIYFPTPTDMSYGITTKDNKEFEDELSRKIFGLTYDETNDLIKYFNELFHLTPVNVFNRYPSITRSIKTDNYCEITDIWIPAEFPYIAFHSSEYNYSHISLYSFYNIVKFLTQYDLNSLTSKSLITKGLNPEILQNLFHTNNYSFSNTIINRDYHYRLDNIK